MAKVAWKKGMTRGAWKKAMAKVAWKKAMAREAWNFGQRRGHQPTSLSVLQVFAASEQAPHLPMSRLHCRLQLFATFPAWLLCSLCSLGPLELQKPSNLLSKCRQLSIEVQTRLSSLLSTDKAIGGRQYWQPCLGASKATQPSKEGQTIGYPAFNKPAWPLAGLSSPL